MLPTATIIHRMTGRTRIRIKGTIPDRNAFFDRLRKSLKTRFALDEVRAVPLTGSLVLYQGKPAGTLDLAAMGDWARKENLFSLESGPGQAGPRAGNLMGRHSRTIVERINRALGKISGNHLDMESSVFLILIIHALREVAAGRLTAPSWFTALWFASSIYNRKFSDAWGGDGHDDSHDPGDPGHS